MAGTQGQEIMVKNTYSSTTQRRKPQDEWKLQWEVEYARCFTYPSSYLSTAITTSILSPLHRNRFQPIWLSSSGLATVSLHPSFDNSSIGSILTVNFQGTIVEEHFISRLQFVWPQVSCRSGFPTRGSLTIIASYLDSSDEKQKFAIRFLEVSKVEEFVTSVKDILSNKIPNGPLAIDGLSAISSESEFVPPFRPDTSNVFTPICDSIVPTNLDKEGQQDSQIQDTIADSQSVYIPFPPSFTSLVSGCSAEFEQDKPTPALGALSPRDNEIKAQIEKYMQDASFLDMVSKVNEVITELGGDYTI